MALQIAFLGYNEEQTHKYFKQFAEDNSDQVCGRSLAQGYMILKDGTQIYRVPADLAWIRSRRFDQIIVADDCYQGTFYRRLGEIVELERCCKCSIIPEEFRLQTYNINLEVL